MKYTIFSAVVAVTIVLAGCTTVMHSPLTQYIEVVTPDVADVQCYLKTPAREYNIQTPQKVHVERSRHNIDILCKKDGYVDTKVTLTPTRRVSALMRVLNFMAPDERGDAVVNSTYQYPIRVDMKMQSIEQVFIELYEEPVKNPETKVEDRIFSKYIL